MRESVEINRNQMIERKEKNENKKIFRNMIKEGSA